MKTTRTTTADFILPDVMLGTVILTLLGVMSDVDYWEVAGGNVNESHHSHTDNSVSLMGGFSYRVYGNSYARLVHFKSIGSKNTVGQDSVTSLQYEVRF